jgi:hypothetical protein
MAPFAGKLQIMSQGYDLQRMFLRKKKLWAGKNTRRRGDFCTK